MKKIQPEFNKLITSFIIVSFSFFSSLALCEGHSVQMKSITFEPKEISIKVGDSIQWINTYLTDHSATSFDAEKSETKFDTGMIRPKKSSEKIIFKSVGNYFYNCKVHGKTMTGKISVMP